MTEPNHITRREALVSSAGGALGGMLASHGFDTAPVSAQEKPTMNVYQTLGVKTIINAAGTITRLGGSIMPPEVTDAWLAASKQFVNLLELQDKVGERIAQLLKVEAALVTTGAAGGLVLGTAAALTYRDRSLVMRLPLPTEMGREVIRQKTHRECYDQQVTSCGVKLVDVETRDELERAINSRTAMLLSYNVHENEGKIKREEWIEVARRRNIPTLIDAAADAPPVEMLSQFNNLGFDMVAFSGGKALRGPQGAGLLLGRKDLIDAAKLNTAPYCPSIGRGLKVAKEDMVAMWAAVERFVHLDHAAETREWERRIAVIEDELRGIPTLRTERIVPPIANRVPHVIIHWDEARFRLTPADVKTKLEAGDPSIVTARVHGTGDKGLLISVFMLNTGEERIVASRLVQVLQERR